MFTVKVFDDKEHPISDARVVIIPKSSLDSKEEDGFFPGYFDQKNNCYRFEALLPGRYLLKVEKRKYITEEIYVSVNHLGFDQTVYLMRSKSEKFVICGNMRMPIIQKELLAIDPEKETSISSIKKELSKIEKKTSRKTRGKNVMKNLEIKNHHKREKRLLLNVDDLPRKDRFRVNKAFARKKGMAAKRVLIDNHGNEITVLETIYLRFFQEVSEEEQRTFLKRRELRLLSKNSYYPNTYIVEYKLAGNSDIFSYAQKLLKTGWFESAEPFLDMERELTAITPPDLLFQEQWYMPLVRLSDAWERLKAKDVDLTFGSSDVVINIYDDGIQSTAAPNPNAVLADFSGNVRGGELTNIIGNAQKMYGFYDFRPVNSNTGLLQVMPADNNTPEPPLPAMGTPGSHGLGCAGVATASAGGPEGINLNQGLVGAAPNARLLGTTWGAGTSNFVDNHALVWMGGLNPQWFADGVNYAPAQVFPPAFNTPQSPGWGSGIISVSSTWPAMVPANGATDNAVHNITSYGRKRRGTAIFFAAGNGDAVNTALVRIAVHEKVFTVAASSLDPNGEEVRSSYSSWGTGPLNGIDFCAPSHYFYVGTPPAIFSAAGIEHQRTTNYGVISAFRQGTGNLPVNNQHQTTLAAVVNPTTIQLAAVNASVVPGAAILINAGQANSEGARIAPAGVAGTTITLTNALKQVHAGGNVESIIVGQADARDTFGGTSSATPLTAGIGALVLSANPHLTFLELRDILQRTAEPIDFRLGRVNGVNMGWQTQAPAVNITDASDQMVVNAAPAANTVVNNPLNPAGYAAGATGIQVAAVANFSVGQVILFGAETVLTSNALPAPPTNIINVANTANFQPGMNIIVGGGSSAVLSRPVAAGAQLRVSNTKGFQVGQSITFGVGANAETRNIAAIVSSTTITLGGAAIANAHNKYDPVVLTNTEPHVIQPGGIGAGTLTLVGNIGNPHNIVGANPRVWVQSANCEIRRIKAIDTVNNVLTIDPLINAQPNGTPVTGGLTPSYSQSLGFGRVNADAAVQAALNFNHNARDLIIRNTLTDGGITSTDVNVPIDSPDIWIRTVAPPAVLAPPHTPPNYATSGSTTHQKPIRGGNRWIYTRIGNRGTQGSFDYSVHTYVGLLDTERDQPITVNDFMNGPDTPWPNPAVPTAAQTSYTFAQGFAGTFLIGTQRSRISTPAQYLPQVASGGNQISQTQWNQLSIPALPLTFASVILTNTVNNGNTTIQVSDSRGFKTGQVIQIGLPATPNQFSATIQSVAERVLTLTAPVAGLGAMIPTGVQVMRLKANPTTVQTALVAAGLPSATVDVADATHLMPGQYILAGPPGNATSEITQIASINYNNAGNDVVTLITNLTNPRGVGDAVSVIEGKLGTFVLSEVTPHDGLLAGNTPYDNNNISCKEVFLGHRISFLDNNNVRLNKQVQVDTAGTSVTVNFRIRIEDPENFTAEHARFTAYRLGTNDQMDQVTFNFAGGNWVKTGGAWLNIVAPVLTIGGANAVGGPHTDMWFVGSFTVTNAHKDIRLAMDMADANPANFRTIETFKIDVNAVTAPGGSATSIANSSGQPRIGGTQRMFAFADLSNVTQSATQAFGPIDTHRFRVSSLFSAPPANSVMAYAVLDGLVFVQENPANNTMNLIIHPLRQADIYFTKVKYFIYRGLRKADFVDGGTPTDVRPTTGNPIGNFVDMLHQTNQTLNPGSTLTLAGLNWENKPTEEFLDNYFFSAGTDSQLPVVSRGMELGHFHNAAATDEFGFEIVLAEGDYPLTIADAQKGHQVMDVSSISDPNDKKAKKEEILHYVDPAAYFGMHFHSKLQYPVVPDPDPNAVNHTTYTGADIYNHVVSKFYTKNALYIDIRNEHGYSYNFDDTYTVNDATSDNGKALRMGNAPSSSSNPLEAKKYEFMEWPILVMDNQNTPIQSNQDTSSIYLNLAWNRHNSHPQMYVERGFVLSSSSQNRFMSHSRLLNRASVNAVNEGTATFTVSDNVVGKLAANDFIGLHSCRFLAANRVYRVVNVTANAGNPAHTDIQVDAGSIPAGTQAVNRFGHITFEKWTKDIAFSYPVITNGTAGQRINIANTIKLRYYRRLNPNVRAVANVNQGAQQITVNGDITSILNPGDFFILRGSTPVGANHNDGEYSVNNAAGSVALVGATTRITVNEAIPAASNDGEVYISDQKKVKTAHYHDNVFGSLNALNRKITIHTMTAVNPTRTMITVRGDFLATANLNNTLNIVGANIAGNNLNGLAINNRALNGANTEITVDHAANALVMDTTGYIQLIYSVWKSEAPTRWLSGFDKRFIDAKETPVDGAGQPHIGFSYVGQTGIALETDGVIFYATPLDFFEAPGKNRVPNSISINGGTSTEDSFWKAMQNQNQRLKLNMTLLKIGATEVPVYDFLDYPGDAQHDALKENFLAMCLTKAELTTLTNTANQNVSDLHDQYLVLRREISANDDNGEAYKRYEVHINGWAKVTNANGSTRVVEREVAPAAPIYVYTHGDDGIVFVSANYPNLGVLLSEGTSKYEEELRLKTEALNIFNGSGAVKTMVNTFVSDLNAITNNYATIKTTVETAADQLWTLAGASAAVQDDRMFYWARLHMRVAIRNHPYLKTQHTRRFNMLTALQDRSRGISSIDFSGAAPTDKKILLVAFDPHGLDKNIHEDYNIEQSSPAAASAISLHGQTVSQGGADGYIQTVILPVRYRALQRGDLEKIVLPLLTGADQVDMICTMHDKRIGRYDIERFASRNRGSNNTDNDNTKGSVAPRYFKAKADNSQTPPFSLIRYAASARSTFLETTLPVGNIIPGTLGNNTVIYNQQYTTHNPADTQPESAPASGTVNLPAPNAASNPELGSSGDFLFNEAFYRIALIRQDVASATKTGHINVERIQGPSDSFDLTATQGVNTNITTIIKDALAGL